MATDTIVDVVVIGGGPAGMIAAATAAEAGASVLLLEKNSVLGKKLSITGGGRCNVTNNRPVVRDMLSKYNPEGKFLFSTFTQHGVAETIDWFKDRGVPFIEENEGRLFPATQSADTVVETLVTELKKQRVQLQTSAAVTAIKSHNNKFVLTVAGGGSVAAARCIVATGGTARPETGSTGDGFAWLKELGHTIVPNSATLVPVTLKDVWTRSLTGLTLTDCKLTLRADGQRHSIHRGKLLFTHVGVSGPTILNLSQTIGDLLRYHTVTIDVSLFPDEDTAAVDQRLQTLFAAHPNKQIQNALSELVSTSLGRAVLARCQIAGDTVCNSISRANRIMLGQYLQAVPLEVKGLLGKDKAVASGGGVALEEVDFKTMQSRVVPSLYVIGDTLNINRPSGGYSLQLCWSTGFVAGIHAVASLHA